MQIQLLTFLISLLEHISIIVISCAFLKKTLSSILPRIWVIIPCALLSLVTDYFTSGHPFLHPFPTLLLFLDVILVFQMPMIASYFVFICTYVSVFIFQLSLIAVIQIFHLGLFDNITALLGNSATLLLGILLYNFIPVHLIYNKLMQSNRYCKFGFVNIFLLSWGISLLSKISTKNFYDLFIVVAFLLLILLYVNFDIMHSQYLLEQQKKQLDTYQTYLPMLEELIHCVRTRQHDFNNQIQAMAAIPMNCTSLEEARETMSQYTGHLNMTSYNTSLLKISQKLVAGFLFSKTEQAKDAHKHLNIQLNTFQLQTVVPEYELIEMLGILIDNSLEAIGDDETAILLISSDIGHLSIIIKNTGPKLTSDLLKNFFTSGYTTKSDPSHEHGLGLPILKKKVDHYHGSITVYNESDLYNNYLCFEIQLP